MRENFCLIAFLLNISEDCAIPSDGTKVRIVGSLFDEMYKTSLSLLMAAGVYNKLCCNWPSNDESLFIYHSFRPAY